VGSFHSRLRSGPLPLRGCLGWDDGEGGKRQSNTTADSSAALRNDNKKTCKSYGDSYATATTEARTTALFLLRSRGRVFGVEFAGSAGKGFSPAMRFLDGFGLEDQVLTLSACSCGQGAVFVFDAAEGAHEESLHLGSGAGDCGWDV
jgi:hypothetical protein